MIWLYFVTFVCLDSVQTLDLESRVFSGDDLRFEMHKHLVKLKFRHSEGISALCSGSIVDKQWIITSAHCLNGGEKQVSVFHQSADGQKIIAKIELNNVHIYPLWKPEDESTTNRGYDLALLKTTRPIKFSDTIQPIKLSSVYPRTVQSAIIAGYGQGEPDLDPPREGFVEVLPCNYKGTLLCSIDLVRAGAGDSGGSLTSQGKLIGVTSASCKQVEVEKPCTTVYASVAVHYPWIQEVLYGNKRRIT